MVHIRTWDTAPGMTGVTFYSHDTYERAAPRAESVPAARRRFADAVAARGRPLPEHWR